MRVAYSHTQLQEWAKNPASAPAEVRAFLRTALAARELQKVVHSVPKTWGEVRPDIQAVYAEVARLFPDATAVYMTGSRTTGRWRDADDSRCSENGGMVTKRCPSDYDVDVEGLDLTEISRRLRAWNETNTLGCFADHPCYKLHRVEIPAQIWKAQ